MSQDKTGPNNAERPPAAAPSAKPDAPGPATTAGAGGAQNDPPSSMEGQSKDAQPSDVGQQDVVDDPLVAALEANCAQLRTKLDEVLRAYAEGENRCKRLERDAIEQRKYAAGPLASDIAAVVDNLQRALSTIDEVAIAESEVLKSFHEGVALTERELVKSLEKHRVIRIDPKGEKFDPNQHEAMANMPSDTVASGFIAEVFQPGYVLHERVLRPAKVIVSQGPSQPVEPAPVASEGPAGSSNPEPPKPANDTEPRAEGWQHPPTQGGRSGSDDGEGPTGS